jgi:hypothetical protein
MVRQHLPIDSLGLGKPSGLMVLNSDLHRLFDRELHLKSLGPIRFALPR